MLSTIIPTYNEGDQQAKTITKTHAANSRYDAEIIVVDNGITDNTLGIAEQCDANTIRADKKIRATQMNKGASVGKYDIHIFSC